jgi:uncharacterized protein
MQDALRAGDKARLSVVRMALAAVKQREVDSRRTLDDAAIQAVLEKLVKQGREALGQYRAGGREDLAAKEAAEVEILETYLPQRMDDAELDALIADVIDATGAASPKDMGRVLAEIKTRAAGRVDMTEASSRVRAALQEG